MRTSRATCLVSVYVDFACRLIKSYQTNDVLQTHEANSADLFFVCNFIKTVRNYTIMLLNNFIMIFTIGILLLYAILAMSQIWDARHIRYQYSYIFHLLSNDTFTSKYA